MRCLPIVEFTSKARTSKEKGHQSVCVGEEIKGIFFQECQSR